ncbi:MAG: hypothetical protein FJ191_12610 [Gammaproteobacteria bacterium]|nr:hypothetical protein [Gammaproteobacteria bacterium]
MYPNRTTPASPLLRHGRGLGPGRVHSLEPCDDLRIQVRHGLAGSAPDVQIPQKGAEFGEAREAAALRHHLVHGRDPRHLFTGRRQIDDAQADKAPVQVLVEGNRTSLLGGRTPASCYFASPRLYPERLPPSSTPGHFLVMRVTNAGTFRLKHKLLFIANALKQHEIGLEETDDGIWSNYFGTVLLGKVNEREMIIRD